MRKFLVLFFSMLLICTFIISGCSGQTTTPLPQTSSQASGQTSTPAGPPGSTAPTSAAKVLKVGAIYSLTGLGSETEIAMRNGAELCKDWINEKGGITVNGEKYTIQLVVEDQKGVVDGAVAAATKLVEQDKVKFIIGQVVPDVVMAASQVTEPAKVLRSSNSVGIPAVATPDTPYTFRACPTVDPMQIQANYDYLVDTYPDVKTIALIDPDEPGGQYFMSISEKEALAHGLTIVSKEFHDPQETQNFAAIWTKVLAKNPDAVDVGTGFPIPISQKLKEGRQQGYKGPVFGMSPVELYTVLNIVGKENATNFFNSSLDIKSPNVPAMIKDIQKRWEANYTSAFMFEGAQGWDALWALCQAIEAANSLDTTVVKDTWEKMTSIDTSYGKGHMGGLQTYGVSHIVVRPSPISRLENGNVELIKWYTPEVP
jgi:branched-chain amino acid transport system substrate-binding protein